MNSKDQKTVKSILGEDVFEVLEKSQIYKPNTKTAVDPEEIRVALEIVPRAVLGFLFANLKHRQIGETVELPLPFAPNASLLVNKHGPDNYKGEVIENGYRVSEFQSRSLPSIGLILLTQFELYDMALIDKVDKQPRDSEKTEKLQDVIDERLSLHRLVHDVVERKLSEREAINKLIRERLHNHITLVNTPKQEEIKEVDESMEKKSKLKQFLENREKRKEEHIEIDKSEIKCPDCTSTLHKKENDYIKLCVCFGEHMGNKIKIKKSENKKVKLKFPKSFNIDNIEMLLDSLKNK